MTRWYRLVLLDDLTCLTIILRTKTPWEDLVNKDSKFADFVRFRPHTYLHTHSTISAAFMGGNQNRKSWVMQMRILQKQSKINRLPLLKGGECNASRHVDFMGNYLTVSHTCLLYLTWRWAFLFVPGVVERNEHAG